MRRVQARLKVLHVISGLGSAGAEGALFRLVSTTVPSRHVVVSLTNEGAYGKRLREIGSEVYALGMRRAGLNAGGMVRLVGLIRRHRPDVVQTWMYHADLIGGVAARLAGRRAIVWGVRHSRVEGETVRRSTRLVAKICARLSYAVPSLVVSCSEVAARDHVAEGYDPQKMIVVANGFDLTTFRPDSVAREEQRKRWGVVEDELLLGMVARWHAQKDHVTLLAAAGELASRIAGRWRLVLVGEGMEHCNASLKKMVQSHGLDGRVILAGCASNVPAVMNAIDIHVLSSRAGEAFPNVVAEAMACGTPSVVTAVGDSAAIVSDTGWVVTAGAAGELARALEDATAAAGNRAAWATRCEMARERIKRLYDMERMQQGFEQAWHVALKRTAA